MNFKLTKNKTIISSVIALIGGIWALFFWRHSLIPGPGPLNESILVGIVALVIAFIILYLIISLFQKKKH